MGDGWGFGKGLGVGLGFGAGGLTTLIYFTAQLSANRPLLLDIAGQNVYVLGVDGALSVR